MTSMTSHLSHLLKSQWTRIKLVLCHGSHARATPTLRAWSSGYDVCLTRRRSRVRSSSPVNIVLSIQKKADSVLPAFVWPRNRIVTQFGRFTTHFQERLSGIVQPLSAFVVWRPS